MRIYPAFRPFAKLLIPRWNYLRFEVEPGAGRRQRETGQGSQTRPRVRAGCGFAALLRKGSHQVRTGGSALGKSQAGLCLAAAALVIPACAGPRSFAGIPLAPGAADPELQSLASRAKMGDKEAQLALGIRYEEGRGVPRRPSEAEILYRLAARPSGGEGYIYVPPAAGAAGTVVPFRLGPRQRGLKEAELRLRALKAARRGR